MKVTSCDVLGFKINLSGENFAQSLVSESFESSIVATPSIRLR